MNYIELINQFWQARRRMRLTSSEADLYYFLMQESNIRNWENPFECSNGLITSSISISEKTLIDVRSKLQQKGLISFEAGQRKKKSPVYKLLFCDKVSITESESKTKKASLKEKIIFLPPQPQEVEIYCQKRNNRVDPHQFINFYTAKDWMIGKNKMKDWRAAVRTWENRDTQVHIKPTTDERF